MTASINGTTGVTFPDASTQNTAATGFGFKSRIINGAMMIDQRNAGASFTPSDGAYTLDRWQAAASQSSKFTIQQNAGSVTPPAGFSNYLGCTSSSAYSVISTDLFCIKQRIEGFNTADLAWGTASASAISISFWVRSSLTGTFGGSIQNSAQNRSYPFTYTINSANTWEYKTISVVGETSGTWLTTNGIGVEVYFILGAGSNRMGTANAWASSNFQAPTGATSVVGTNGATFYITGVQLEKGSTATSFDYRPYGTELALCQRYFISYGGSDAVEQFSLGKAESSTLSNSIMLLPVEMRTTPSLGYNSASAFQVNDSSVQNSTSAMSLSLSGPKNVQVVATTSGLTLGRATRLMANTSLATRLTFSAEL